MRNLRSNVPTGIYAMLIMLLVSAACKRDVNNENAAVVGPHSVTDQDMDNPAQGSSRNAGEDKTGSTSNRIIAYYLQIKDALVADNADAAAKAGGMLVSALNELDTKSYSSGKDLTVILENMKRQAAHISKSGIDEQREHFNGLSQDMVDLITITGTGKTLYQDYCPMANNNKGARWLSAGREIKNPYFGSKMLNCGTIQRELN